MALFRLVHASDLHFSENPGTLNPFDAGGPAALLKAAFSSNIAGIFTLSSFCIDKAEAFSFAIRQMASTIDAVLITGDLSTTGSNSDLNAARSFFLGNAPNKWSPIPEAFPALVGPSEMPHIILMPGNHDRYTPPLHDPGCREFEFVFGDYWNFHSRPPAIFSKHRYVRTTFLKKENSVLALCRADFSLSHSSQASSSPIFSYLGQGRVRARSHSNEATEPLDELIEQTEWLKASSHKPSIIWCIHYPPGFPGIHAALSLRDEHLLLDKANQYGIQLILSGHTHEFKSYSIGNGTNVICCGTTTATSTSGGHQYLELLIDTDNLGHPTVTEKTWDASRNNFA